MQRPPTTELENGPKEMSRADFTPRKILNVPDFLLHSNNPPIASVFGYYVDNELSTVNIQGSLELEDYFDSVMHSKRF